VSAARCLHGDPLLDELEALRYDPSPEARRRLVTLCVQATQVGLFPRHARPIYMVDCYGAAWFEFRGPLSCPLCSADLRDYEHGAPFKREIGVYDSGADRTVAWRCPDCGGEWLRR